MHDVSRIFDWLLDGAVGAKTPMDVIARMCPDLVAAGVPLARAEAFVRTLHPHIVGRSFLWLPDRPVEVVERSYAFLQGAEFQASAVAEVFRTGESRHVSPDGDRRADFASLRAEGFTDFYTAPLRFTSGATHAISFATRHPSGFSEDDVQALAQVVRPLSRIAEILALLRTAVNLLDTYVGHSAGERILAGQIQRGDTAVINAVIWFSDLRGFTSMSSTLPPQDIIAVLNELFDCQVPSIERERGEVLKFMGDGLLAIFPIGDDPVGSRCDDALAASAEAYKRLEVLNAARIRQDQAPVRFGLALHVGEVAYGNIGGAGRLDFTCIGPAVNLAARLETLSSRLGTNVIVSREFANATSAKLEPLGSFDLKGVPGPCEAFAPRAP